MTIKDFARWFIKKPRIDAKEHRPYAHEREVWWCHLGTNIGSEQDGKGPESTRPVLIYRKFNRRTCWVIPITTREKENAFYIPIDINDDRKRLALIHQMRMIDFKRLSKKIGTSSKESFDHVTNAITQISSVDWIYKKSEAALVSAASEAEAICDTIILP